MNARLMVAFLITMPCLMQGRMLDVAIFTNESKPESLNPDDTGPLVKNFGLALCQKSYPVIAAASLVDYFFRLKKIKNPLFKDIEISGKNWDMYQLGSMFLFIPKTYLARITQEFDAQLLATLNKKWTDLKTLNEPHLVLPYSPTDIVTGFRLSKLTPLQEHYLHSQALLADPQPDISAKAISNFFIESAQVTQGKQKADAQQSVQRKAFVAFFEQAAEDNRGLWNIILDGHSYYASNISGKDQFEPPHMLTEKDLYYPYLAHIYIKEFKSLIATFTRMNVNSFYYATCYGVGFNLFATFSANILSKAGIIIHNMQPKFTIIVAGLPNQKIAISLDESLQACSSNSSPHPNYESYFLFLRRYASPNAKDAINYTQQQLIEIAKKITPTNSSNPLKYQLSAIPHVKYKNSDTFVALPLTNDIEVVTNARVQALALENRTLSINKKDAILLYPKNVAIPMDINCKDGTSTPIISMQPFAAVHTIKSIKINAYFKGFIKSFLTASPLFIRYFYVGKITLYNDLYGIDSLPKDTLITLHNVVILQSDDYVHILFTGPDEKTVYYNIFKRHMPSDQKPSIIIPTLPFKSGIHDLATTLSNYLTIPLALQVPNDPYDADEEDDSNDDTNETDDNFPANKTIRHQILTHELHSQIMSNKEGEFNITALMHALPKKAQKLLKESSQRVLAQEAKFRQFARKVDTILSTIIEYKKEQNSVNKDQKKIAQLEKEIAHFKKDIAGNNKLTMRNPLFYTTVLMESPARIPILDILSAQEAKELVNMTDTQGMSVLHYLIKSKYRDHIDFYHTLIKHGITDKEKNKIQKIFIEEKAEKERLQEKELQDKKYNNQKAIEYDKKMRAEHAKKDAEMARIRAKFDATHKPASSAEPSSTQSEQSKPLQENLEYEIPTKTKALEENLGLPWRVPSAGN